MPTRNLGFSFFFEKKMELDSNKCWYTFLSDDIILLKYLLFVSISMKVLLVGSQGDGMVIIAFSQWCGKVGAP